MKIKCLLLSCLLTALFLPRSPFAQKAMLKGIAFIVLSEGGPAVADIGVEIPLTKKVTVELSFSGSSFSDVSKDAWSLQSRYYFLKQDDTWANAYFVGGVLQKYNRTLSYTESYPYENNATKSTAAGIIVGRNQRIYKRFGIDMHLGLVGLLGNQIITTTYAAPRPQDISAKNNVLDAHFFWGVNFYLALGKMQPQSEKK